MVTKIEKIKELQSEIATILSYPLDEFINPFILTIQNELKILVLGWTPVFNDGEPCEHSIEWCIGSEINEYEYVENFPNLFKGIKAEEIENEMDSIKLRETTGEKGYNLMMEGVLMWLDNMYGTDYAVLICIGKEGVKVVKEEYDCGY